MQGSQKADSSNGLGKVNFRNGLGKPTSDAMLTDTMQGLNKKDFSKRA